MGWPGTGVELRVGNPGRGGAAVLDRGAGRVCCSLRHHVGTRRNHRTRGGLTGQIRTRLGPQGRSRVGIAPGAGMEGDADSVVAGLLGARSGPRHGGAGIVMDAGGIGEAGAAGGMGCRGPDRI